MSMAEIMIIGQIGWVFAGFFFGAFIGITILFYRLAKKVAED
jgi:hypothetical protein